MTNAVSRVRDGVQYLTNRGSYGTAEKIMKAIDLKLHSKLVENAGDGSRVSFANREANRLLLAECLKSAANYQAYQSLAKEVKRNFQLLIAEDLAQSMHRGVQTNRVTTRTDALTGQVIEIPIPLLRRDLVESAVKAAATMWRISIQQTREA